MVGTPTAVEHPFLNLGCPLGVSTPHPGEERVCGDCRAPALLMQEQLQEGSFLPALLFSGYRLVFLPVLLSCNGQPALRRLKVYT